MPDDRQTEADRLYEIARAARWPSVTTVLKLAGMSMNYDRIPTAALRRDEGSTIDDVIAAMLHGDVLPIVDQAVIERAERACEHIRASVDVKPELVQWRGAHPLGFTGQLDVGGTTRDGRLCVIDVKNGHRQPEHALQVAAYALILRWRYDVKPMPRAGCYYVREGQIQWYDEEEHVRVFLAALTSVTWRLRHRRAALPEHEQERCFGEDM